MYKLLHNAVNDNLIVRYGNYNDNPRIEEFIWSIIYKQFPAINMLESMYSFLLNAVREADQHYRTIWDYTIAYLEKHNLIDIYLEISPYVRIDDFVIALEGNYHAHAPLKKQIKNFYEKYTDKYADYSLLYQWEEEILSYSRERRLSIVACNKLTDTILDKLLEENKEPFIKMKNQEVCRSIDGEMDWEKDRITFKIVRKFGNYSVDEEIVNGNIIEGYYYPKSKKAKIQVPILLEIKVNNVLKNYANDIPPRQYGTTSINIERNLV